MAASLMLAEPTVGPQGRRSAVAISKNVFVRVFDVAFTMKLYYSVGVFDEVSSRTEWGENHYYGKGKQPSVALITKDEKFYAIDCHRSQFTKQCYYRIGEVKKDIKRIDWIGSEMPMCKGVKPKVSATDSGKIVVVNEETFSRRNFMSYQIGKLIINDGNPRRIAFNDPAFIVTPNWVKLQGVEPDITINENSAILIYRSGFSTISSQFGTFEANDESITWHDQQNVSAAGTGGINPCISLNSRDYCVESHQTKHGRLIRRNHGRISQDEKRVIWANKESSTRSTLGEYPAIALNNDGFIVETHKINFGKTLYQSYGELKIRPTRNLNGGGL